MSARPNTLSLAHAIGIAPAFDWFLASATDADLARELETLENERRALCRGIRGDEPADVLERATARGVRLREKIEAIRAEQARRAGGAT